MSKPRRFIRSALRLGNHIIWRPFNWLLRWLNTYNAVFMVVATGVIAWFTIELATYAGHQETILNHQIADSEATQRAFVFIDTYEATLNGTTILVRPKWKNSGTTPTEIMTNWVNWKAFDGAPPKDFVFPDVDENGNAVPNSKALGAKLFLSPGSISWGEQLPIEAGFLPLINKSTKSILIYGWARYSDVFHAPHITRFAVLMKAIENKTVPTPPTPSPNAFNYLISFDQYDQYNCTDDECRKQGRPY